MWRFVADELAEKFTVVVTDLRGYGQSSKPKGSETHVEYSKREMANDQVAVMKTLGFECFRILAHDRGARVAHRLAVDHPHAVVKIMLLDICPTLMMYETTDRVFAAGYWHWFALIVPGFENVISADPKGFWDTVGGRHQKHGLQWEPEAIAHYQRYFFKPEMIHASCEDYRASATIDLEHDREDIKAGRKIQAPLKVLWGSKGMISKYDALAEWRKVAGEVEGRAMECGHFVAEEQPDELKKEALAFLA